VTNEQERKKHMNATRSSSAPAVPGCRRRSPPVITMKVLVVEKEPKFGGHGRSGGWLWNPGTSWQGWASRRAGSGQNYLRHEAGNSFDAARRSMRS